MKLAVNYSEALLSLLHEEPDLPVDYIKVPTIPFPDCWPQFDTGEKYRKILPHPAQPGVIALGHPKQEVRFNRGIITELLRRTDPPYLSTHMEARTDFIPELSELQHESSPLVGEALMEQILSAIREVKREVKIPLVLENFPYYSWWIHYKMGSDPRFISEICTTGDCGFLLDTAHARCSAWYFKMHVNAYLNALPLERLREIHLAGVKERPEGIRDTHTKLEEDDYLIFEYVLTKAEPEIVTIEYGGLPDQILNLNREYEHLPRNNPHELREMINRVKGMTSCNT